MGSVNFITHADVLQLIAKRTAEDCIIFLSGPTSRKTPLSLLRMKDVIAVNGSVQYLLNNNVKTFLYLLTDVRFLHAGAKIFITLAVTVSLLSSILMCTNRLQWMIKNILKKTV